MPRKALEKYMTPLQLKQAETRQRVHNLYLRGYDPHYIGLHCRKHPSQIKSIIRAFEKSLSRQEVTDIELLRSKHRLRLDDLLREYYEAAAKDPDNLIPALNGVRGVMNDIMKLEGTAVPVTQVVQQDVNISGNMLLAAISPSTGLPSQAKVIEHES